MAPIRALLISLLISTTIAAPLARRQLHGEGVAADALLTDTDDGVGYGTENAEDKIADNISSVTGQSAGTQTGGSTSGGNPPPPPPPPGKRQLDKVAAGTQSIADSTGFGNEASSTTTELESVDGTLTDDAANAGTNLGAEEETTLENAGSSVP